MFKAYESGDVYTFFGKQIGLIPANGTKVTHKLERDICKEVVLAMSYLMSEWGLAPILSQALGKYVSEDEARVWINDFDDTFWEFAQFRKQVLQDYMDLGYIRLADGWYMWGDNELMDNWGNVKVNFRSIINCPIQGMGAVILRKAVALCQDAGLEVISTLHDALKVECDLDKLEETIRIKRQCMKDAFTFYFTGRQKEWASIVKIDTNCWGPELTIGEFKVDDVVVKTETIHVDERSKNEYDKFNKYFTTDFGSSLL
jgi:DNA polymerase I-like protein with 3'-5' exonuclease and polymerase domains